MHKFIKYEIKCLLQVCLCKDENSAFSTVAWLQKYGRILKLRSKCFLQNYITFDKLFL